MSGLCAKENKEWVPSGAVESYGSYDVIRTCVTDSQSSKYPPLLMKHKVGGNFP